MQNLQDSRNSYSETIQKIVKNLIPPFFLILTLLRWQSLTVCDKRDLIGLSFLISYSIFVPKKNWTIWAGWLGFLSIFWIIFNLNSSDVSKGAQCSTQYSSLFEDFISITYWIALIVLTLGFPILTYIYLHQYIKKRRELEEEERLAQTRMMLEYS